MQKIKNEGYVDLISDLPPMNSLFSQWPPRSLRYSLRSDWLLNHTTCFWLFPLCESSQNFYFSEVKNKNSSKGQKTVLTF